MMRINIKIKDGKKIYALISPKENIMKIKNIIEENEYIPVGRQHLIFEGEILKNDNFLFNYDLENGSTILLVDTNKSLKSQIKDISKININIENVDDLLNESLSYFDEELDDQITKELFNFIKSCFSKFANLCIKILDKRLKKKEVASYHLIITASVLQKYFNQFKSDIIIDNYSDFISSSIQDILSQSKDIKNKELNVLGFQIPPQYKLDFITDIVLLSQITEQIVIQLSEFFFSDSIETEKLDNFIKKVYDLHLLDFIPQETFIKNNFFLRFPKDIILHFISISNNQTFQKICSPITNSITEKDEIDSSFSDVFVNKCIYNGLKLENPAIFLNKFTQFKNQQFFEYLNQFDIKVPKKIIKDKKYIQILIKYIIDETNTMKSQKLFRLMFKFLMTYEYVSTKYILIQLEKYTKNLLLEPEKIFEYLNDLYNEHKDDFDYVLKTFYGFSQKNKVFNRKLYTKDTKIMEMPIVSFLSELCFNNFRSFVFLRNIISTFPFLIEIDNEEPRCLSIALPYLDCFSIFFEKDETNENIDKLKLAASAFSFIISCLYSTEFLSKFVPWLFKKYTKLNDSRVIFMTNILYNLFQTRVINKIVLAYAIKYKLLKIIHELLDRDIPDSPFRDYYYDLLYKLSAKFIDLISVSYSYDDISFINKLINDQIKNPFEIKFNGSSIITDIIINPINILFKHENNYTKKITLFFKEIGESQPYWIYNDSPMPFEISAKTQATETTGFGQKTAGIVPAIGFGQKAAEISTATGFGQKTAVEPTVKNFEPKSLETRKMRLISLVPALPLSRFNNENKKFKIEFSDFLDQFNDDKTLINEDKLKLFSFPLEKPSEIKLIGLPNSISNFFYPEDFCNDLIYQMRHIENLQPSFYYLVDKIITNNNQYINSFFFEYFIKMGEYDLLYSDMLFERLIYIISKTTNKFNETLFNRCQDNLKRYQIYTQICNDLNSKIEQFNKDKMHSDIKQLLKQIEYLAFIDGPMPSRYQIDDNYFLLKIFYSQSIDQNLTKKYSDDKLLLYNDSDELRKSSPFFRYGLYKEYREFLSKLVQENILNFDNSCFLREYFEIIPFSVRLSAFKNNLKKIKRSENIINLNVTRLNILPESFNELSQKNPKDLLCNLKVNFRGENENDSGDMTKKWFTYIVEEFFNPNYALFIKCTDGTYHPSRLSFVNEKHLDYFRLAGEITALALIRGQFIPAHFSKFFLRQILHQMINFNDLEAFDDSLFKSLKNIFEIENVEELCLSFCIYDDSILGEIEIVELIKDGENIDVTNENRDIYVALYTYYRLRVSMLDQIKAFCSGFNALIPADIIKFFTPKELDLMIHGISKFDVKDFQAHTKYKSPYMKDHVIIQLFFKVISCWSQNDLSKLLKFITGSSQLPLNGFKDFEEEGHPITIAYSSDCAKLPIAHACCNTLYLPKYKTEKDMNEKLLVAVNNLQ